MSIVARKQTSYFFELRSSPAAAIVPISNTVSHGTHKEGLVR
jgi:hypothetical protein